jgi:hypothetical protein
MASSRIYVESEAHEAFVEAYTKEVRLSRGLAITA